MREVLSRVEVLSKNEIAAIHQASLSILETVGCKFPNKRVLNLFEQIGASVNHRRQTVKLKSTLIEKILKEIPRAEKEEVEEGALNRIGNVRGSMCINPWVVDYESRERRYGTVNDVMRGIVVANELENIESITSFVFPQDVPKQMSDIIAFEKVFTYSEKKGSGGFIFSSWSADYIIQLAKVMGRQAGHCLEPVSPLQYGDQDLEIALKFADHNLPMGVAPMVSSGGSGPVTLAGTLALQNAEILMGTILIHLLRKEQSGSGWYSGLAQPLDMQTTVASYGSPSHFLLAIGQIQMGRFYGFTPSANLGYSDSLGTDYQSGFEASLGYTMGLLAGMHSTHPVKGCGMVGADQGVSLEQLVIDNESIGAFNHLLNGIEVNEETIALELIKRIGIGGNFLAEEHTVKYMRKEHWPSELFTRDNWESWLSKGKKNVLERAHEKVEAILAKHFPPEPVIDEDKVKGLRAIVKEAERNLP